MRFSKFPLVILGAVLIESCEFISTPEVIKPLLISYRPLSNRLEQTYASFPECIRWSPESLHTEVDDESFFKRVTLRLQTLELKLLLDRMAYKYNLQNGQVMVDCAREMLELLVTLWVQRDRFIVHHHDYDVSNISSTFPSHTVSMLYPKLIFHPVDADGLGRPLSRRALRRAPQANESATRDLPNAHPPFLHRAEPCSADRVSGMDPSFGREL